VPLTPKSFEVLALLVKNHGRLVKKDALMNEVWPNQFVDDSSLTQNIYLLRKALDEGTEGARFIETVPRAGYRFLADVKEPVTDSNPPASPRVWFTDRRMGWIAGVVIAVFTVSIAALLIRRSRNGVEPAFKPKSLAVLPFTAIDTDPNGAPLGIGMAEATILRLSKAGDFSVLPVTSVLRFQGANVNPLKAGQELGVESVLSGTLQQSDGRIRVTVQLSSVKDGGVRWSAKFDDRLADIFTMQDSLSQQLAGALALHSRGGMNGERETPQTHNVAAYQSYLMGLYLWNKRTPDSLYKAVEYFEKAAADDPEYALAYAGIADTCALIANYRLGPLTPKEAWEKTKAAAEKAIQLNDATAEAYPALAMYKFVVDKDQRAADELYKRAILLNPNYAIAHLRYGWLLITAGDLEFALSEFRRAQQLDPASGTTNTALSTALVLSRRYDEAIDYSQRSLDIDSANDLALMALAESYAHQGKLDRAMETLTKYRSMDKHATLLLVEGALISAIGGRKSEASRSLAQIERLAEHTPIDPYVVAGAYALLGQPDDAFRWLHKIQVVNMAIRFDPNLDSIKSDPRFTALLRNTCPRN
jgi:TolB-like protein/Tfp pilus assembly protein PilF